MSKKIDRKVILRMSRQRAVKRGEDLKKDFARISAELERELAKVVLEIERIDKELKVVRKLEELTDNGK